MIGFIVAAMLGASDPAPHANPPPSTLQSMFDSASAAASAGKCEDAATQFAALEADPRLAHSPNTLAVVRIRKGDCLLTLDRPTEAEGALRVGLERVDPTAEAYADDRRMAHIDLGMIAFRDFDYPVAKRHFELAGAGGTNATKVEQDLWLARATMFDGSDEALERSQAALSIAIGAPTTSKQVVNDLHTIHARALLNQGRLAEAYSELKRALSAEGGLTEHVNASQLTTRADLALAALLNHDENGARQYLAYTGAGHSAKKPFASAASMESPECGGPADLKPEDFAVVEFGVNENGAIDYAIPIYASRAGPVAVEFARAVSSWSWRPEDAKVLPPLFRLLTRVELRCSTVSPQPAVLDQFRTELGEWLGSKGGQPFLHNGTSAADLNPIRQELKRREMAGGGVNLIPVLLALVYNPVVDRSEREASITRAVTIATAEGAPPKVRAYLEIVRGSQNSRAGGPFHAKSSTPASPLEAMLSDSAIVADATAADAIRITLADAASSTDAGKKGWLTAVADDTRLPPHDPLRVGALVRLASIDARKGDLAEAREAYEKTGLKAQQCALVDAKPDLREAPYTKPFRRKHSGGVSKVG